MTPSPVSVFNARCPSITSSPSAYPIPTPLEKVASSLTCEVPAILVLPSTVKFSPIVVSPVVPSIEMSLLTEDRSTVKFVDLPSLSSFGLASLSSPHSLLSFFKYKLETSFAEVCSIFIAPRLVPPLT